MTLAASGQVNVSRPFLVNNSASETTTPIKTQIKTQETNFSSQSPYTPTPGTHSYVL